MNESQERRPGGDNRPEAVLGQLLVRLGKLTESDPNVHDLLKQAVTLFSGWLDSRPDGGGVAGQEPDVQHAGTTVEDRRAIDDAEELADETTLQERVQSILRTREVERAQLADQSPVADHSDVQQNEIAPSATTERSESDTEGRTLVRLAADASLKAEASRWVGERQRRLARGADFESEIAPYDREMMDMARQMNVFLWMCRRDAPVPADAGEWDNLSGNFDALADALRLNAMVFEDDRLSDSLALTMSLLAEAQSALHVAVDEIDDRSDETQLVAFRWLKRATDRLRIYISHFMRINDPADPHDWGALREKCAQLDDVLRAQVESERQQGRQWGRLRYHLQQTKRDAPALEDWDRAFDAVNRLVAFGVAPSSVKLRDVLLPFVDDIPDELDADQSALLALREIDRYLASREAESPRNLESQTRDELLSEEEERVRALVEGRALVLIGGIQRPKHKARIEHALSLSELIWLDGGVASYTQFEPAIARPDVAAVILLIRWSSHGYGDAKIYCDTYGKPLIRIPAGYNPKQLAHQILEQAADRLSEGQQEKKASE